MSRYSSAAYDLSLFEERRDNTVRLEALHEREPRREEQQAAREKVVGLPQQGKQKKPRRHFLRRGAAVLCFGVIFSTVTLVVYNQVQLTELTDQINTTTQQLEEAESLEVQLNMEVSQQMNGSQVEEYATQELGMKKVVSDQVTYVNVAEEDQGAVVRQASGGSFLDKLWSTVVSWFA